MMHARRDQNPVVQLKAVAMPQEAETARTRLAVAMILFAIAGVLLVTSRVRAEDDKAAKEYDNRLKQNRSSASLQGALDGAMTDQQKAAAKKAMSDAKTKEQGKKDMADYKQKTLDNLASIKELFAKAEESWKNKLYGDAAPIYNSVAMATVPGAEQMVETSHGRIIELEDLAKDHLKAADDADLKRDYAKEVEELSVVNKDFALAKSRDVAVRRLVNLKSRPEVAGIVELAQAEGLEADGKLMDSIKLYESIGNNPRYENTVVALKAKRKLEDLNKNDDTRTKIKTEQDAKAEREAPVLLNSAKNFVSNNLPKMAMEKLQLVIDKYPSSKYAEDAKKLLAELK